MTPGVRPAGAGHADQRRVVTPAEAIAAGASHIVVGRPITEAVDLAAEAKAILQEIGGGSARTSSRSASVRIIGSFRGKLGFVLASVPDFPHGTPGQQKLTLTGAGIATSPGQESDPESGPLPATNRTRIKSRIARQIRAGIGQRLLGGILQV